ncbi:hypothetical protein B9Q03_00680 [Candidatus Marsarchaeota G2 archaeon OSP_D]|uniref:Uncharacterized protein n=1 Tax=Candidatus Marsarchaeota G2 archaeon OSP_D TaxID=1978157 RepID=A0A2R6B1S4_9ARCH|nr:MAG: hypothetical protein B9Q03_00680 [Candidatus Marsarchaeota G2 archaeon OSP_D]
MMAREEYIRRVEEDVVNLQRLMRESRSAEIVVADRRRIELAKALIPQLRGGGRITPQMVEFAAKELGDKKSASGYIQRFIRSLSEWREFDQAILARLIEEEASTLRDASSYLREVCGVEIRVVGVNDASDKIRAENAIPLKPTITFLRQ